MQNVEHASQDQSAEIQSAEIAGVERIQERFDELVVALTTDDSGAPRPDADLRACTDGVRAALDSLAHDEPVVANSEATEGSLAPGTILANAFVVRALIGIGGMAEVYQVRHRDLRCDYAVKILKPEKARDPLVVDLFAAEARALLALRHDGIVRAYSLLRHCDGRPFLILDLARGPTLAETLLGGALEPRELRSVAYRLATSLAALHTNGYVHGDLSAENVVLVGGLEGAVLLDLGLAQAGSSSSISFAGKWSIASPEQIDGAPSSPQTDMYALGLILAAAATGTRLDMGHDQDSARAARRRLPDLRHLPRSLAQLVGCLLHADPLVRPSAQEIAKRFEAREPGWSDALRGALADIRAIRSVRRLRQLVPGSKTA